MRNIYKTDEIELVELGQFIRDIFPNVTVKVEWYVIYDISLNKYLGYQKTIPINYFNSFRNPDFIITDKKTKKLITCLELDGGIHTKTMFSDTKERNDLYKSLNVPLIVITKAEVITTVYDLVYKELSKVLL